MPDEKVENIPSVGTLVQRSSFRDRKKEKFRRHIASLSSPGSSSNNNQNGNAGTTAASPMASHVSSSPSTNNSKSNANGGPKVFSPPTASRVIQSKTSEDSERFGGTFSKRQINYVATSPSEDSDASYPWPKRVVRSLMTNPSEDSMETPVYSNNLKKNPAPKIPSQLNTVTNSADKGVSRRGIRYLKSTPSADDGSVSSVPGLEHGHDRIVKTSPRPLARQNSGRSSVSLPFDEVEGQPDTSSASGIPFDEMEDSAKISGEASGKNASANQRRRSESPSLPKVPVQSTKSNNEFTLPRRQGRSRSATRKLPSSMEKSNTLPTLKVDALNSHPSKGTAEATTSKPSSNQPGRVNSCPTSRSPSAESSRSGRFLSRHGRSVSVGRKSVLIDKMAKKQATLTKPRSPSSSSSSSYEDTNSQEDKNKDQSCEETESEVTATITNSGVVALLRENLAKYNEQFDQYDDPPVQELESEVSAGFDMGSIHDHLPGDNPNSRKSVGQGKEAKKWSSSNVVFEDTGDEKKVESDSESMWQGQVIEAKARDDANGPVEEKKEKDAMEISPPKQHDGSWDTSARHFAQTGTIPQQSNAAGADGVDMFDTSSWACESEAKFSDVSLSRLSGNPEIESQFVKFMMEEIKVRALTKEERRMLFHAQKNLQEVEERKKAEQAAVHQDDLPLIGQTSSSDDGLLVENSIPIEERLKMYSASGKPDEESISHDEGGSQMDSDEDFDDDAEAFVEYVNQHDRVEHEEDYLRAEPEDVYPHDTLVSAEAVPTLQIEVLAKSHATKGTLDRLESLQMVIEPPPPPPPGRPKKKNKRNKSKSGTKNIPLIAPPPEEKMKKWEDNRLRAEKYAAAMKERHSLGAEVALSTFLGGSDEKESQATLFSTPERSPKSEIFNDITGHSKSSVSILADEKLANKVAIASSAAANAFEERFSPQKTKVPAQKNGKAKLTTNEILSWFSRVVLKEERSLLDDDASAVARLLINGDDQFNAMCHFLADTVNEVTMLLTPDIERVGSVLSSFDESTVMSAENTLDSTDENTAKGEARRALLKPMMLSDVSLKLSPTVLAANFVSFFIMVSKLTKVCSPFGDSNPFLAMIVESSLKKASKTEESKSAQELLFAQLDGKADLLVVFVYDVKCACDAEKLCIEGSSADDKIVEQDEELPSKKLQERATSGGEQETQSRRFLVPKGHPSPFESSVWEVPRVVAVVLTFLGDPVAVCRMKMVNRFCHRVVSENEHMLMQNAVRTGGIEMSVRPAFWMWVTLEKNDVSIRESKFHGCDELRELERQGEEGKWHHVIQRDVERSFGNMPPHKTGARFRTDSIVKALVTWGQNRIMKRGVKGGGEPLPIPDIGPKNNRKSQIRPTSPNLCSPPWENKGENGDEESSQSDSSETPTETVTDWGGVSPKGSFAGSVNDPEYEGPQEKQLGSTSDMFGEELALSGNSLTADVKGDLRKKLSFILHSLAATYDDIGYCQGLDYVVAHLLRILQETIKWKAANNALPTVISSAPAIETSRPIQPESLPAIYDEINRNLVVEETVLRVMDVFFMNYNLRHMYWPELRCLKTCCRVFERLIQIKLPVLADHFEHHDLNVGLFALGWFQTLFLYLPSMPSATVCHMWDIWLVERSLKIFFRVGTAILFLSQPILLNHELEGMMTYLNTIPDATLLRPDILIPCALNIKVTNQMLQDLEAEVMKDP